MRTAWPLLRRLGMTRMVFDVANDCRRALLDILGPHAATWGPTELALWLAGPYRKATRWAHQSAARKSPPLRNTAPPASKPTVIEQLLASTRRSATYHLDSLRRGDGAFIRQAMANQTVVPRCDGNSGRIVPVDVLRMRLIDRVLSLAAADCLARPHDYTKQLHTCTQCCSISFDEPCAHPAIPAPRSGIHLRAASSRAI